MPLPINLAEAHALILRQREELAAAVARASGAEALIAHMKLVIAKLRREQYGQSSERGRKVLDQLELQLEELEAETSENAIAAEDKAAGVAVKSFARQRPVRAPLPAHLPRERAIIPAPCACPVCGGRLAKLGEDITETMEGDPDGAGEVHLPILREDHPATGAVPCHCPRPCWSEPTGDDPLCQIRPAPAAQSAK